MSLWQSFYGKVLELRRQRAATRLQRLPRPVISLGNLHWGGGGKTPMTQAVACHLRDQGHRVVVLSRGHKRKSRGPLLVSRGDGPLVSVSASGDEPALHARLEGVGVVVAEQRYAGGCLALEELECDVFLLDDGFSHVQLARDLEILLFPAADPLGGSKLLPTGRLREPLSAAQHADAAVLTGLETATSDEARTKLSKALQRANEPFGWQRPTFVSQSLTALAAPIPIQRALLVTAVARPSNVHHSAQALAKHHGFELSATLDLPDHHAFPRRSLATIEAMAADCDTVLVTGKDWVKLRGRLKLSDQTQLVEIQHRAAPQTEFLEWLDTEMARVKSEPRPET